MASRTLEFAEELRLPCQGNGICGFPKMSSYGYAKEVSFILPQQLLRAPVTSLFLEQCSRKASYHPPLYTSLFRANHNVGSLPSEAPSSGDGKCKGQLGVSLELSGH